MLNLSNSISNAKNSTSIKIGNLLWPLLGLVIIGYGLLAFNAGTKLSPVVRDTAGYGDKVSSIQHQAEAGELATNSEEVHDVLPYWLNLVARFGNTDYAYGNDSIMETSRHYYEMSEQKRSALSTHMMLGMVLMATGFFQFWPGFRRKHRKIHRILGVTYILTAFTSMSMSSYYLLNNKVADTYSQYAFHMGLSFLVVLSIFSISMAGYSIYKKNIAAHLGWQAIAFGCFLTAPIQRIYWIGMAPFAESASFNEMNIIVNVSLVAQAMLVAYLLFYFNRASSPLRSAPVNNHSVGKDSRFEKLFGYSVIAITVFILFYFYVFMQGMGSSEWLKQVVPNSALVWHDTIFESVWHYMFFIATSLVIVFSIRELMFTQDGLNNHRHYWVIIVIASLVGSLIQLMWGFRLGLPTQEYSLAGSFYAYSGLLQFFFTLFFIYRSSIKQLTAMKEALWFVLLLALAPAIKVLVLYVIHIFTLVPELYIAGGHGYQLAAAFALLVPVLSGLLIAVYSAETKRYEIN